MIPIVIAFAAGAAAEFINYLLTRSALGKNKNVSLIFPLRTLITAAFLAAIYFGSKALSLDTAYCMIAAALGATAGLAVFTFLLIKDNKKGGGTNG